MSGFHIHETVRYLDGKEVERIQRTTCSECGAELKRGITYLTPENVNDC